LFLSIPPLRLKCRHKSSAFHWHHHISHSRHTNRIPDNPPIYSQNQGNIADPLESYYHYTYNISSAAEAGLGAITHD
jgi:hypothetical protein